MSRGRNNDLRSKIRDFFETPLDPEIWERFRQINEWSGYTASSLGKSANNALLYGVPTYGDVLSEIDSGLQLRRQLMDAADSTVRQSLAGKQAEAFDNDMQHAEKNDQYDIDMKNYLLISRYIRSIAFAENMDAAQVAEQDKSIAAFYDRAFKAATHYLTGEEGAEFLLPEPSEAPDLEGAQPYHDNALAYAMVKVREELGRQLGRGFGGPSF